MPVVPAASAQLVDVTAAISTAVNGDTVTIPAAAAGTAVWTTALNITKAITLQGAGIGNTIIMDGFTGGSGATVTLTTPSFATWPTQPSLRMTGIEFRNGGRTTGAPNGVILAIGHTGSTDDGRRFRIDHCKFDHLFGVSVRISRGFGVIDNNQAAQLGNNTIVYLNGTDSVQGDALWSSPTNFNGENFVFVEDNSFLYDTGTTSSAVIDSQGSLRYVFRHNTCRNTFCEAHGTESVGRPRGAVVCIVNDNILNWTTLTGQVPRDILGLRSGTALVYNNTGTGWKNAGLHAVNLVAQRTSNQFGTWGIADGTNPWDQNDPANVGGPTYLTSAASTGLTVPVSGGAFAVNELEGKIIRKLSAPHNVPITAATVANPTVFTTAYGHGLSVGQTIFIQGHMGTAFGTTPNIMGQYTVGAAGFDANHFSIPVNVTAVGTVSGYVSRMGTSGSPYPNGSSLIVSNTATVITYEGSFNGNNNLSFPSSGHTFEINKITRIFDEAGVGGGTNVGGALLPTWPLVYNQDDRPVYEWNNTLGDVTAVPVTATASIRHKYYIIEGTHFFTDHRQPVGYVAFTYPHPLASGGDTVPPAAPTGLTVQ